MQNLSAVGLGMCLVMLVFAAGLARAMEVPDNIEALEHPERLTGPVVVRIRLQAGVTSQEAFADFRKENGDLLGYQDARMLAKDTKVPVLMTRVFDQRAQTLVRIAINWDQIVTVRILDPKVKW